MPKRDESTNQWSLDTWGGGTWGTDGTDLENYTRWSTGDSVFHNGIDPSLFNDTIIGELKTKANRYNEANDFQRFGTSSGIGGGRNTQLSFVNRVNEINKHKTDKELLAAGIYDPIKYKEKQARIATVNNEVEEIKNPNSGKQQTNLVIGGTDENNKPVKVNLANETLEQLIPAISSGIPLQGIEVTNPDGSKSTIDPKALTGAFNKTQQQEQAKMIEQVGLGAVLGKFGKDLELRNTLADTQQRGNYDLALNNQQNTATITKSMMDSWLGSSELANQRASTILNTRF